jgi:hypothetical protein
VNQLRVIAAGKVRASDGVCEQHVADDGKPARLMEKDDMPGCMPGAVLYLQRHRAHAHRVTLVQPASWRENLRRRHAVLDAVARQGVDPELVALVRPLDGQLEALGQLGRSRAVIQMRVRQQDALQLEPMVLDDLQHLVQISTGIDDRGLVRPFAADDGAVLLKRGDRYDGYLHSGNTEQGYPRLAYCDCRGHQLFPTTGVSSACA